MSDDFGLSSEDEEGFLAAAESAALHGKRGLNQDGNSVNQSTKRVKTSPELAKVVSPSTTLANKILKRRFGLDGFRLEQEAAITRILDGGSAVVVFPTGGGKSLCYQVRLATHLQIVR